MYDGMHLLTHFGLADSTKPIIDMNQLLLKERTLTGPCPPSPLSPLQPLTPLPQRCRLLQGQPPPRHRGPRFRQDQARRSAPSSSLPSLPLTPGVGLSGFVTASISIDNVVKDGFEELVHHNEHHVKILVSATGAGEE